VCLSPTLTQAALTAFVNCSKRLRVYCCSSDRYDGVTVPLTVHIGRTCCKVLTPVETQSRRGDAAAMGAHGTCEEALANVASFASASQASKSSSKHSSSKSSKHKSHKKHKKSKDKAKDKKGTHNKHKKASHSSSSEDSSDGEGHPVDLTTQLAHGRQAARVTRRILAEYPDMRGDLREVSV